MMKKRILAILLAAMLLLTLTACGSNTDAQETTTGATEGGEAAVRDDVIIGLSFVLKAIEPQNAYSREEQYIIKNVFDTLFTVENGEYVMKLATSMEVSEDLKTVKFTLRDDVYFHNGEQFTSADVAYVFENLENFPFWAGSAKYVESVNVIDDFTIEITQPETNAYFITVLSGMEIINEKAVTELGEDHAYMPVGTGPYIVESFDGYSNFYLTVNEDYWGWEDGQLPDIKKINYRIIEDEQTLAMALESGEIDFFAGMDASNAIPFETNDEFTVNWLDRNGVELVLFNCGVEPFDDKLVRQAVSYAIDRESYNLIVAEGKDEVWDYFYNPKQAGAPNYDDLPHYTFDVEKSKELLAEAGYPEGFTLDKPVIIMASQEKGAIAVQQMLEEVGIFFEIEILEQNTLFDAIFSLDYQMLVFGLSTEILDISYNNQYYSDPATKSMMFPTGEYFNEEVNDLIIADVQTTDLEERAAINTELYTLLFEEQPIVAIASTQTAIVKDKDLNYATPDVLKVEVKNLSWAQ